MLKAIRNKWNDWDKEDRDMAMVVIVGVIAEIVGFVLGCLAGWK